jgi:opacity protein-like surface antigen
MKTERNCAVACWRLLASKELQPKLEPWKMEERIMKWGLFVPLASILLFTIAATAQEVRNEVSVQGTGFFTKDSNGNGVSRTTTKTGGLEVGYRYHINRWLSAEANYGFDRNTQKYFSNTGQSRVQSDVHGATADVVVNLPLHISKFRPYALAGGGGLIFHPTGNGGGFVPGADTQAKGAFLYGGGADYDLTHRFSLRAEYRGFVYKDPDFGLQSLKTDTWTHTAQPTAGIVYRF